MHLDVQAINLQGSVANIRLNREPDSCPICHKSIHSKIITSGIASEPMPKKAE